MLDPLANGNNWIVPLWNLTLGPNEAITMMLVANQGGYDIAKMHTSVLDIDANPFKLYAGTRSESDFNSQNGALNRL